MTKQYEYDINNEPLVISKSIIDILLEEENPGELIALYTFYYYTAKWQKTNQPKATTSYAATGLKLSIPKIRKNKKILIQLNLIENVVNRDNTSKITGHYIKVNFIWGQSKVKTVISKQKEQNESVESHQVGKPTGGQSHQVANDTPNPLNANNINPLNSNKENTLNINKEKTSKISGIYKLYSEKINSKSRLTNSAKKKIETRLNEYSFEDLKRAIMNFSRASWWMKHNTHRGVAWFFHTEDRIDQFLNLEPEDKKEKLNL